MYRGQQNGGSYGGGAWGGEEAGGSYGGGRRGGRGGGRRGGGRGNNSYFGQNPTYYEDSSPDGGEHGRGSGGGRRYQPYSRDGGRQRGTGNWRDRRDDFSKDGHRGKGGCGNWKDNRDQRRDSDRGGSCRGGRDEPRRGGDRGHRGRGGGGGDRPPPHLRGRAIGLWHRDRQVKRNKEHAKRTETRLPLEQEQEQELVRYLDSIRDPDCPQQPIRSYADPDRSSQCFNPRLHKMVNFVPPDDSDSDDEYTEDCDFPADPKEYVAPASSATPHASSTPHSKQYGSQVKDEWDESCTSSSTGDDDVAGTSRQMDRVDGANIQAMAAEASAAAAAGPSVSSSLLTSGWKREREEEAAAAADSSISTASGGGSPVVGEMREYSEELIPLYDEEEDDNAADRKEESAFMQELRKHNEANRSGRIYTEPSEPVVRDPELDARLKAEYEEKSRNNNEFLKMLEFRQKLPSYKMKEEILSLVRDNQVVVLSGETGCGKTTQVTQFLLDDAIERGDGSLCKIVCTQPRRISAVSVAQRVAEERGERVGESSVGFQIRLECKKGRKRGSILYCTNGILLKFLESDPLLEETSHVVLDEIHERDLISDFLVIILRDILPRRPTLKLILMSATLNAEKFSQYYNGCPQLNIPGFTFPVKEFMLEEIIQMTSYGSSPMSGDAARSRRRGFKRQQEERENYQNWVDSLNTDLHKQHKQHKQAFSEATLRALRDHDPEEIDFALLVRTVEYICQTKPCDGAILVFLPGIADIKKTLLLIKALPMLRNSPSKFLLIPLHSQLPTSNQQSVFKRPAEGVRKIVLSTNIAETSVTIEDVVYVVDSGKIKQKNFDPATKMATLKAEWVARANAKQRRGRAGRVRAGECYHLFSSYHEKTLADYQLPEILRTRLEELCLQVKMLKLGMVEPFVSKAMEQPSMEALHHALVTLRKLNAIDENEDLMPLGYHLAKMPVDPHTGKMLLFGAMFCCLDPILTIAAFLSFKDPFSVPMDKQSEFDAMKKELAGECVSDHLMLVNAYNGWVTACQNRTSWEYCRRYFLAENNLKLARDMRQQFATKLHEMQFIATDDPYAMEANKYSKNEKVVKAVICAGLFPNVAKRISKEHINEHQAIKLTTEDSMVAIHPRSINSLQRGFLKSHYYVYHEIMKTSQVYLTDTTQVHVWPLLFFGNNLQFKQNVCTIDKWITFAARKGQAKVIQELRDVLDQLLEFKHQNPGPTKWDESREGSFLQTIVKLITEEKEQVQVTVDEWNKQKQQHVEQKLQRKEERRERRRKKRERDMENSLYWELKEKDLLN